MHVVEIKDREASLAEAARLQDVADYLILDSPAPAGIGSSGRTHDWEISRDIVTASSFRSSSLAACARTTWSPP